MSKNSSAMSVAGYLELIIGPMFSGKTTRLIEHYKAYKFIGKKIVVINYSLDVRYSSVALSSHDRVEIPCVFSTTLDYALWQDADVVLINEGQFFQDLMPSVLLMIEKYHKRVYICGLDGDFKRQRFGAMLDLIPYCDRVEKLNAFCSMCRDGKLAIFSHRIVEGQQNIGEEGKQILIGSENYLPLCRGCYIENDCKSI
jgi:thymidine kinase